MQPRTLSVGGPSIFVLGSLLRWQTSIAALDPWSWIRDGSRCAGQVPIQHAGQMECA